MTLYKLCPTEPTEEILEAMTSFTEGPREARRRWNNALAAAPNIEYVLASELLELPTRSFAVLDEVNQIEPARLWVRWSDIEALLAKHKGE